MTWTRLSDTYPDDTWTLSDPAFRLHTSATVLCNRLLSDGFVERGRLQVAVPKLRSTAIHELVEAGLWREVEGGYHLVKFLEDQLSRVDVLTRREGERLRKERQRARPADEPGVAGSGTMSRRDNGQDTNGDSRRPHPVPAPTLPKVEGTSPSTDRRGQQSRQDWGDEWLPFLEAWADRGFRLPLTERQRRALWPIANQRPNDLAVWVRAAPKGAKAAGVVGHAMLRWDAFRNGHSE